jgi:Flp pilus assembly protein TadD
MDRHEQERAFRRGLGLCRSGRLSEAARVFRHLVDGGSDEPLHLSYCGLLTATVQGDRAEGLRLCERAIRFGAYEPQVVTNLARIYEAIGARGKAVALLRRGLREHPGHPAMAHAIDRLSPRRRPPLSMLERDNPLNKHLAIALAKATGRYHGKEEEKRGPVGAGAPAAAGAR